MRIDRDDEESFSTSSLSPSPQEIIPVLGLFINTPPLIIGGTQWLSPPTPLQWQTIEFCVESLHNDEKNGIATVSAAPLVAIVNSNCEMATLAAIVGIQQQQREDEDGNIDTTDSSSLQESLAAISRRQVSFDSDSNNDTPMYSETARVRLLGIGRAKLTDFTTLAKLQQGPLSDDQESNDEEEDAPIVMAYMKLVLDGSQKQQQKDEGKSHFSRRQSPVHAINELSMWTSRLEFLHRDRQELVQGLQAAQARLEGASQEWQDWDGIGNLFQNDGISPLATTSSSSNQETILQDFLAMTLADENLDDTGGILGTSSVTFSEEALRVSNLNNYGLGTTPSAYSDLQSLSKVLKSQLLPYYSPSRLETEEFDYCMVSWVALQSLLAYLPKQRHGGEIRAILEHSNTIERMEHLYDCMMAHKQALQELAQAKSRELRNCGEECTDLF